MCYDARTGASCELLTRCCWLPVRRIKQVSLYSAGKCVTGKSAQAAGADAELSKAEQQAAGHTLVRCRDVWQEAPGVMTFQFKLPLAGAAYQAGQFAAFSFTEVGRMLPASGRAACCCC